MAAIQPVKVIGEEHDTMMYNIIMANGPAEE